MEPPWKDENPKKNQNSSSSSGVKKVEKNERKEEEEEDEGKGKRQKTGEYEAQVEERRGEENEEREDKAKRRRLEAVRNPQGKILDLRKISFHTIEHRNAAVRRISEIQPDAVMIDPACDALRQLASSRNPEEGRLMEMGKAVNMHLEFCKFIATIQISSQRYFHMVYDVRYDGWIGKFAERMVLYSMDNRLVCIKVNLLLRRGEVSLNPRKIFEWLWL